jgi:SAM-dependent methyltransferase
MRLTKSRRHRHRTLTACITVIMVPTDRSLNNVALNSACRFCGATLRHTFVDLGMSPLCESYLAREQLDDMERFYPLHVNVCGECFLVQLQAYVSAAEIFSDYAYFSSYSDSWVEHARLYTEKMVERFDLGPRHQVVELASNDGYLLQHFVARGIPALGVEPAANVAEAAARKGIQTVVKFFGIETAREMAAHGQCADLLVANNVLAQVPDLNDFVAGIKILLKPQGLVTLEFPHLMRTIQGNQFDQIYHEHFSYFSFTTANKILAAHGLTVFDVEELSTHGGSLRVYARHFENGGRPVGERVREMLKREARAGVSSLECYSSFGEKVKETKRKLLSFLIEAKRKGQSVAAYGAPGKGNTLLNYCGIRSDFLDYTVDRNPHKQGKFLPGTHVPIYHPDKIKETKPDYVLILAWNLKTEIMEQVAYIRSWGGRFVVPIPEVRIYDWRAGSTAAARHPQEMEFRAIA